MTQVAERQQVEVGGMPYFINEAFEPTPAGVAELAGQVVIAQQVDGEGQPFIFPAHDKQVLDPSNPDPKKRFAMCTVPAQQVPPIVGRLACVQEHTGKPSQRYFMVEPVDPEHGPYQPTAVFSFAPPTEYQHQFHLAEPVTAA